MRPTKERSRGGCLPCLQKRKKCDETKPTCTRCSHGGSHCVWRSSLPRPVHKSKASVISLQPPTQYRSSTILTSSHDASISAAAESVPESGRTQLVPNDTYGLVPDSGTENLVNLVGDECALASGLCHTSGPQPIFGASRQSDTPHHTQRHASLEVSDLVLDLVEYASPNRTANFLDEDEEEVIKTLEWIPEALGVFGPYLPCTDQINWLSALSSYFTFSTRYVYESSNLLEATRTLSASYGWVNSARLGLLSTAVLFHSYTDPLAPQSILRERSKQLIDAATASIQLEMAQPSMPLSAVFAGISVILVYHYYSGDLIAYVRCIEAAAPMVKALIGPGPVEFHRLRGAETIDIRSFVWCDIFTAIAASRPTRLTYDCNVETLLRKNQEAPNSVDVNMDVGLEWMCGLPDAMLMLIIQIVNLRHSPLSQTERLIHAARIEKALRDWKVWLSRTTNSIMRVQRMGAQEIWRYFAILYLYQAIHQASPSLEVVQESVRQIFKLGSMLRPGHNPDCLLTVPYFVAGTFAVSVKHRQFFRRRLLGCGIETYGKTLAKALEELWQKSFDTGKHNDWTTRSSPVIIFS
ncbi:unnamed protein product [Rhizoctonia solani]|uniref:Zn(2)-C6 fungal-type domain-containing protein n=1 Tax=Rhizoctonia solani TaxID=456999 RepID=A0A8H3A2C0_9AGAM|nr:unnamed protein product [Rhizoctonia solani]